MANQAFSVNNSAINLMSGISLNMDSLEISPVEIEEVVLSNFNSDFAYPEGALKDTRMRFEVKVALNWRIGLDVKFFDETIDSIKHEGSLNLFEFDTDFLPVDLARIDPGRMKISIPKLKMGKFKQDFLKTEEDKQSGIVATRMDIEEVRMDEAVMTTASPALFGGTIPIKNPFGPQNMSISNTQMKNFSAVEIKMPPFYLTNLQMQEIEVDKVVSDNFIIKSHTKRESAEHKLLDLVYLKSTIDITATVKADKVELSNLKGDIKADRTSMRGMTLDFKLKDIQIKDLKINEFDLPDIGIGL